MDRFSPVAGIQWVETLSTVLTDIAKNPGFSPVAGIQWVETLMGVYNPYTLYGCFSPVAGIQWVETRRLVEGFASAVQFQSRCRDSVG